MNFQEVLNQALQLSTVEKVRLIQQIAFDVERQVAENPPTAPQPPAWNQSANHPPESSWTPSADQGQRLSNSEIDRARWEDWANFPD